jgi:hypothetical protein
MSPGDLAQALPALAVREDGSMVQNKWRASDVLAFETGAPHSGAHSLDDQVALKFSDGANDDDDGAA